MKKDKISNYLITIEPKYCYLLRGIRRVPESLLVSFVNLSRKRSIYSSVGEKTAAGGVCPMRRMSCSII